MLHELSYRQATNNLTNRKIYYSQQKQQKTILTTIETKQKQKKKKQIIKYDNGNIIKSRTVSENDQCSVL